jgi:hypothetical protein
MPARLSETDGTAWVGRDGLVILSGAKTLQVGGEILRCAQNDRAALAELPADLLSSCLRAL